jgi:hypothetical protein
MLFFGKRTDVKDSHDSHASIEIKYVLRKAGKNGGLTIRAIAHRTNIDKALSEGFMSLSAFRSEETCGTRSLSLVR